MEDIVKQRILTVMQMLPENNLRQYLALEAKSLGRGGLSAVSKLTGVSMTTLRTGARELPDLSRLTAAKATGCRASAAGGRIRAVGAGRPRAEKKNAGLLQALARHVGDSTYGSPQSALLWTTKSLRNLESALADEGFKVSYRTIGTLLEQMGYSLQLNQKNLQVGEAHMDRDAQFRFINSQVDVFLAAGQPVISIDAKKKENVGNFIGKGAEYAKKGEPVQVLDHDFPLPENGKATPYGIYDIGENKGFVNVGISADTAEFAVDSIWQWWNQMGREMYPGADRLLVTADGGGSNGVRNRLWKVSLQRLADATGLELFVSHFPPGTSKWNKIEHRMFSQITKNWRGRPLVSLQVIISLIAAVVTSTGLTIKCQCSDKKYETGIKVSDAELAKVKLTRDLFHGEWNYCVSPTHKK